MNKMRVCRLLLVLVLVLFGTSTVTPAKAQGSIGYFNSEPKGDIVPTGRMPTPSAWFGGHWGEWTGWSNCSGDCTRYFAPARAGYHAIEFCSDYNVYHWGTVQPAWRSGNGPWNYFRTSDVLSRCRTITLFSGSSEVNYQFFFDSYGTGKVYYRFFID